MKIEPKFKLWFEVDGKPVIGEGRADLLLEIYECGSLSKAAENLGISYRQAHNLIGNLNERYGEKIIETAIGGVRGGGTQLTDAGKRLVENYLLLKEKINECLLNYSKGNII